MQIVLMADYCQAKKEDGLIPRISKKALANMIGRTRL
jgi:hypothetical protein